MSHDFSWKQEDSPHHLDIWSYQHKNGIDNSRKTNIHTFPILNVMTNIAILQDKYQVITVSFQVDSYIKEICWTISKK